MTKWRGALACVVMALCVGAVDAQQAVASKPVLVQNACLDYEGSVTPCGQTQGLTQIVSCRQANPIARDVADAIVRADPRGRIARIAAEIGPKLCLVATALPGIAGSSHPSRTSSWTVFFVVGIGTVAVLGFLGELWQCYAARRHDPGLAEELVRRLTHGEELQWCARPQTSLGFTRRLWIATDKRLLLVWRRPRGDGRLVIAEIGYRAVSRIKRVSVHRGENGSHTTILLEVEAGTRKLALGSKKADALLEVLSRCAGLERPARRSWWRG